MPYTVQWINQWQQLGYTMADAIVTDSDNVLPPQRFSSLMFRTLNVDWNAKAQELIAIAIANNQPPPSGDVPPSGS